MVLLDFGLAEELTPRVRRHFISFLHAIVAGDGAAGARHLLAFGEIQKCHQPVAFQADMIDLFRRECDICAPKGINVDVVRARLRHSGLSSTHTRVHPPPYAMAFANNIVQAVTAVSM